MYKKKRKSKRTTTPKKDLLSTVNKIVEDATNKIEVLDFEEETVYEQLKKEEQKDNKLKKTSEISKKINRKLNSSEILDYDKTTSFEPIKLNNIKKPSKKQNKKNHNLIQRINKYIKIKNKQVKKKLKLNEVLDYDKTTTFEPIKLNNIKKPSKKQSKKNQNLIQKINKYIKTKNKQVKKRLKLNEVLDYDKTTTFEPIKLNNIKKPSKKQNKKNQNLIQKINKYIKTKNKQVKKKIKLNEVLDYDKTTSFEPINIKKQTKKIFNLKIRKTAITCLIIIILFVGFQQITTDNNIITQQAKKVLASLGIYTEEIRKSEILSSNYGEEASWKVNKSVEWIDKNKVELTIELDSIAKKENNQKNIILLVDNSSSMEGTKLITLIDTLKNFVDYFIQDSTNQISLVTFNNNASIINFLTNDKEVLKGNIDRIDSYGDTNYSSALKTINQILDKSTTDGKDTTIVLITDGHPNINVSTQNGEYALIKDTFPKIKINAIQYEMGNAIINELKNVSDEQRVATQKNIKKVLLESTVSPEKYEDIKITDYVNTEYFNIESLSDINTTTGTAMILEENGTQKIEWTLNNNYITGEKEQLKAILRLKDEFINIDDLYLVSENTEIISKRKTETEKKKEYKSPVVLKNAYEIIYEANVPEGCTIDQIKSDKYFIYSNATQNTSALKCNGYLFKGWEYDEEDQKDIIRINNDVFKMPPHNVTLRGTWTRQSITKSMDGSLKESATLYKVLESAAKEGTYAKEYTGEHQDSMDASKSTEKIYHFYGADDTKGFEITNMNNVIFASHCWQMIRTTDTGGVKLIYNGEVEDDKCLNTRGTHVGYNNITTKSLVGNYWYGTDYEYNETTKTFKVSGTTIQTTWNDSTSSNLIGKYTCANNYLDSSCSTLYYVESYYSSTTAKAFRITGNSHYSQVGITEYNNAGSSISSSGYMYNKVNAGKSMGNPNEVLARNFLRSTNVWCADDADWSSTQNKYILTGQWKLTPERYSDLIGKYAYISNTETNMINNIQYIVDVDDQYYYYITLSDGNNLEYYNDSYTYGDSYVDNGNGTYTIKNATTIKRIEWKKNYNKARRKYICKNAINNTCSDIHFAFSSFSDTYYYLNMENKYRYANKFSFDGEKYILDESTSEIMWDILSDKNLEKFNNAHYTCFNTTGECTNIAYIYFGGTVVQIWYLNLSNGQSIDTALNEMLYEDNVNSKDSLIKTSVDAWYEKYLLAYSDFIEDTIFCNDRSIINKAGLNPNGGDVRLELQYKNYPSITSLVCTNITDKFSINNSKAKLKYKVGLLSFPEMQLLNSQKIRYTGQNYWSISPNRYSTSVSIKGIDSSINYDLISLPVSNSYGIRPSISLRPGIEYLEGDGSMEYPYVIDTSN